MENDKQELLDALAQTPPWERLDRRLKEMKAAGQPFPARISLRPHIYDHWIRGITGPVMFVGKDNTWLIPVERCPEGEEPFL